MIYTDAVKKAIIFAIKTHEVYKKQKRKGTDVAYITHPLSVGLILALAGAEEDVVVAGILHDTIEDSAKHKRVDAKMITARFGRKVAYLVMSVTEKNKDLPWEARKKEAVEQIADFSHGSLLIKAADTLNNGSEIIDSFRRYGKGIFKRFNASQEKIVAHYLEVIEAIIGRWPEIVLREDLIHLAEEFRRLK